MINGKLILYNGMIQTLSQKNEIKNILFEKTELTLDNISTRTIKLPKIQETSTFVLLSCLNKLFSLNPNFLMNIDFTNSEHNCSKNGLENIYKELYKRFIIPLYIPILILISLMAAMYSKENINYSKYRLMIFLLGLFIIIFSETTLKFIDKTFIP